MTVLGTAQATLSVIPRQIWHGKVLAFGSSVLSIGIGDLFATALITSLDRHCQEWDRNADVLTRAHIPHAAARGRHLYVFASRWAS